MVDQLSAAAIRCFYGALGENLTTRGLEMRDLRMGDRCAPAAALLEITQARGRVRAGRLRRVPEARDLRPAGKGRRPASPRWGMSGFKAGVIEPGRCGRGI